MVLWCSKSFIISTSTLQKEAKEEAGVARGDGVAVRQEDVVHHEAEAAAEEDLEVIVAEEALEVIVVGEALGAAEAQEGSAVVVAVAAEAEAGDSGDLEEVVVDSEGHDTVFMYVKHNIEIVEVAISHSGSSGSFRALVPMVRPFQAKVVSSPSIRSYPLTVSWCRSRISAPAFEAIRRYS